VLNVQSGLFIVDSSGGAGIHSLDGTVVNNQATVRYMTAGSDLDLINGTSINNSGLFDFQGDINVTSSDVSGGFNNLAGGEIRKSVGTGLSDLVNISYTHTGSTVNLLTGSIGLGGAILVLDGGSLLTGFGTLLGNLINNGGIIRPGGTNAIGTITVSGDYTNTAGTLEVEIDSAVTHDVLAVNNFLDNGNNLTSILDISLIGFIPSVDETHNVITCVTACVSPTVQFGTVTQPSGVTHGVAYNATNLNLTVTSVSFFWDGGGALNNWFDPLNWSLDVLPNLGTDVVLTSGNNVTFDGGIATVAALSLGSGSSLNVTTGTLTILDNAAPFDINVAGGATLTINGGDLINNGFTNVNGSFVHSSGNVTFTGNTVVNGSFNQGGGIEVFTGTAAFNGSLIHSGGLATFNNVSSFNGAFNLSGGAIDFQAVGTMLNLNNSWIGGTITGAAGPSLVLGVAAGDTTLAIAGGSTKTLDTITINMNLNDINMSGTGNLVLANGAVIDNTNGQSFNHSGSGDIAGTGTFINDGGAFNNTGGSTTIAVDFQNNASSSVNVTGGVLTMADIDAADQAIYNIGGGGNLVFAQDRTLTGAMNLAGTVGVTSGTTLTLPGTLNNTGVITLVNATLKLANLSGNTLQLNSGTSLGGTGVINGNVVNNGGVLVTGGAGSIGNLQITGTYTQNTDSALIVEVFNNGFTTISDVLTVDGVTTLNGGALVIGYTSSSLGLVTANFRPFTFSGGASGNFSTVFDAGGNILFIDFSGGVFTILGATPEVPDDVIQDILSFAEDSEDLIKEIMDNRSEAEATLEELLEEDEEGSLICT
jgi:hypothetical protein